MTEPAPQPAAEPPAATHRAEELLQTLGLRVNNEHDLISHRMTWLMTLNGFLITGLGVVASARGLSPGAFTTIVVGATTLAALSNASCFYSNCLGSRAMVEATNACMGEIKQTVNERDLARLRATLRMYGRDPGDPERPFDFWNPITTVLHPWHLLPLLFAVAYVTAPFLLLHPHLGLRSPGGYWWGIIPLVTTCTLFGGLIVLRRIQKRKTRCSD